MMTDEMKKYVIALRKAKKEKNDEAIREFSRAVSECSKECKLTSFEFTFVFSETILFADYLFWLVMYAKEAWEGAVDDGWADAEFMKERKDALEAE